MQDTDSITFAKFVRAIAKWINRHYFVKTIISGIPIIVGIIVSTPLFSFGVSGKKLNGIGWTVLISTFLIILLVQLVTNYIARNDDRNSKSYWSEIAIRNKISQTEIIYNDEKNSSLRSGFKSLAHTNNQFKEFITHYVKPIQRTEDILKQISSCIEKICEINQTSIIHSAIIKVDNHDWQWLCKTQIPGTANLLDMNRLLRLALRKEVTIIITTK